MREFNKIVNYTLASSRKLQKRKVPRKAMRFCLLLILLFSSPGFAGDDASGDIPREVDFGATFTRYEIIDKDETWSRSLVGNFKYKGKVVHFVRTSIPILSNGKVIEGRVYQSVEKSDMFYIAEGDLMFKMSSSHPYSPGVGGFSMHSPKSKNFIVCLNCLGGGVPALSSSKVIIGRVKWKGTKWNRL